MKNNKQRTETRETINGMQVTRVALSKTGVPQLSGDMKYYTVGLNNNSVKIRMGAKK